MSLQPPFGEKERAAIETTLRWWANQESVRHLADIHVEEREMEHLMMKLCDGLSLVVDHWMVRAVRWINECAFDELQAFAKETGRSET